MIRSITRAKRDDEIRELLDGFDAVFLVGCGTCSTLCRTGGVEEVAALSAKLTAGGKTVTGTTVIPVACDELSEEILEEHEEAIKAAGAIVVMACAFGTQTIAARFPTPTVPAVDTLFLGRETGVGRFEEVCTQCGTCIIGFTGGICPVTSCHKGLLNGPCGGTDAGMCEIDKEKECAWTNIYRRLADQGRLDLIRTFRPPHNHQAEPKPGKIVIPADERGEDDGSVFS